MEFLFAIFHSEAVPGIHNPDDSIGLFKVVSPVRTKRALSADIPCMLLTMPGVLSQCPPTDIQSITGSVINGSSRCVLDTDCLPFVHESLDVEPQGRTNGHDIFTVKPL